MTLQDAIINRIPVSIIETKRSYNTINLPSVNAYMNGKAVQIGAASESTIVFWPWSGL